MSQNTNTTAQEHNKKPESGEAQELNEKELEDVSGGINPQPLPPMRRTEQ